jgi:hypothetical protein
MAPGIAVTTELYDIAKGLFGPKWADSEAEFNIDFMLHEYYKKSLGFDSLLTQQVFDMIKANLDKQLSAPLAAEALKTVKVKQYVITGVAAPAPNDNGLFIDAKTSVTTVAVVPLSQPIVSMTLSSDLDKVELRAGLEPTNPAIATMKPAVVLSLDDLSPLSEILHASNVLQLEGVFSQLGVLSKLFAPHVLIRKQDLAANNKAAVRAETIAAVQTMASAA